MDELLCLELYRTVDPLEACSQQTGPWNSNRTTEASVT